MGSNFKLRTHNNSFQHGYDLPAEDIHDIVFPGEHAEHSAPYAWQIL